jgi:hypothetical protein
MQPVKTWSLVITNREKKTAFLTSSAEKGAISFSFIS